MSMKCTNVSGLLVTCTSYKYQEVAVNKTYIHGQKVQGLNIAKVVGGVQKGVQP